MREIKFYQSTEGSFFKEREIVKEDFGDTLTLSGKRQKILGFGACFNEMGYEALQCADKGERDKFYDELFGEVIATSITAECPSGQTISA